MYINLLYTQMYFIWIIFCSRSQSQMACFISFLVVNVVVNATFWHCDVHPLACYMSMCFAITAHLFATCPPALWSCPPTYFISTYFAIVTHLLVACFAITPTRLLPVCLHRHHCPPILPSLPTCLLHVLSLACCLAT
jgi:hypothetical protein